jgi:hypothetical protein
MFLRNPATFICILIGSLFPPRSKSLSGIESKVRLLNRDRCLAASSDWQTVNTRELFTNSTVLIRLEYTGLKPKEGFHRFFRGLWEVDFAVGGVELEGEIGKSQKFDGRAFLLELSTQQSFPPPNEAVILNHKPRNLFTQ